MVGVDPQAWFATDDAEGVVRPEAAGRARRLGVPSEVRARDDVAKVDEQTLRIELVSSIVSESRKKDERRCGTLANQ